MVNFGFYIFVQSRNWSSCIGHQSPKVQKFQQNMVSECIMRREFFLFFFLGGGGIPCKNVHPTRKLVLSCTRKCDFEKFFSKNFEFFFICVFLVILNCSLSILKVLKSTEKTFYGCTICPYVATLWVIWKTWKVYWPTNQSFLDWV